MDFKSLLQTMSTISEGEKTTTDKGTVHKGEYGNKYGKEDVRDQYGHKVGKRDKGEEAKKEAPKKGRGRPKKDVGDAGTSFDSSALTNVLGGKKPSKAVGTTSKKHSLKEYIESTEQMKRFESVMEGMFGGVDHTSVAANLGKLARVIKSVQTPEQFAVAQKYASRMKGTIMNHQHDKMGFGSGLRANLGVMRDVDADLKAKADELGIDYQPLEEAGDQVEIKPASQTQTSVIQQGDKTLGTVNNPQLAAQIKQSLGKGEMSFANDEQKMMEGKKAKPDFLDVDKDDNKKESFKKAVKDKEDEKVDEGKKPDFLDVDKDGDEKESFKKAVKDKEKKKVDESISLTESPETLEHIISKFRHEVKNFINGGELDHDLYEALFDYYFNAGEMPYGTAKGRTGDPYEWISDRFDQDVHDHVVDENSFRDFTQHPGTAPTNNFRTIGQKPGAMTAPRGSKTVINRPVPEPTPWSTDPIAAASDRAFNFIDSLKKKTPFSEGTDMKDKQFESWSKQLNGLLTEGLTVSSSTGQHGQPNTVTVSATDNDADSLMQVLRSAGIGGFGAEPVTPEVGYGVAQGGEDEPTGTGTEPQAAPDVVGDDGDMLSMLKKMAGLSGGDAEVVAVSGGEEGGEEGGQDYEDEEGSDDTALQPASGGDEGGEEQDSGEESDEEGDDESETTDEGNAFGQEVNQKKHDDIPDSEQRITTGGQNLPVKEEESCDSCGHSPCDCEEEHVEESFANSANDPAEQELMKLKALLSMGSDMHKVKSSQTVGNPTRVQFESTLGDWKKLSGIR